MSEQCPFCSFPAMEFVDSTIEPRGLWDSETRTLAAAADSLIAEEMARRLTRDATMKLPSPEIALARVKLYFCPDGLGCGRRFRVIQLPIDEHYRPRFLRPGSMYRNGGKYGGSGEGV